MANTQKLKKALTSWRMMLLIAAIVLSLVAINPNPLADGVAIRSVMKDSAAALAGMESPRPTTTPMGRERVIAINNQPIESLADYTSIVSGLMPNQTVTIKTTKDTYRLLVQPLILKITLNETEEKEVFEEVFDASLNATVNKSRIVQVQKTLDRVNGTADIGLRVYEAPTSNIRKGLDLSGGTRVLLEPEREMAADEMDILLSNMKERLNVYGLSDIIVKQVSDLSGKNFVLVEIAGATDEEVKDLLSKQGKFEAKIGEDTVFRGGQDITYVCRSADCSGIDTQNGGCSRVDASNWVCRFQFAITLSPDAAQRQADVTKDIPSQLEGGERFLNKSLDLYLDDDLVDTLRISESLKGRATTDISISGAGFGNTQQAAMFDALKNMKRLQTILITGSLPVKLTIAKSDSISPALGDEFLENVFLVGAVSMLVVILIIFIRYRALLIVVPVAITLVSEMIIMFGFAALIGWNMDLIALAGILIAIGTGVNDQIVMTDEILGKHRRFEALSWKDKIKNAFFIIFVCYFTLLVAMLPLWFAGAGLLKGFAITTIAGITIGVLITRPAFAVIAEAIFRGKEDDAQD